MKKILLSFVDDGFVIPFPNPWVRGLRVRFLRWDLDPSDKRVGVTIQLEWK